MTNSESLTDFVVLYDKNGKMIKVGDTVSLSSSDGEEIIVGEITYEKALWAFSVRAKGENAGRYMLMDNLKICISEGDIFKCSEIELVSTKS